jgi:quinol-cytochrome oxidoreductase complex cytochrome b subunit
MWSGFLLALYYVPDPSFVITYREEYMNEVWWFFFVYKTHVIGVDSIFILSYLHILKKLFIKNFIGVDIEGWASGTFAFLVFHVVVFLGITLSTNHLGDLTLTIGATIFWSLFGYKHKIQTLLFTNRHLNMEQLLRFMIAHYVMAWYYVYLIQTHVVFIHEMWDSDSGLITTQEPITPKSNWLMDAMQKEALMMMGLYIVCMLANIYYHHPDIKPVNFTFFEQWSETEMEDMNFFIVGPHWYFRPHMGLLTICAQHYEGLFWLILYYVILALMPLWSRMWQKNPEYLYYRYDVRAIKDSYLQLSFFIVFMFSMCYVGGTLPCARFYYEEEEGFFGNMFLRLSYQYIYVYLFVIIHALDRIEVSLGWNLRSAAKSQPRSLKKY